MARDIIRRCIFRPYLKGHGPTFSLTLWDTGRNHPRGTSLLGYRLVMTEGKKRTVLFEGEDFSHSPMDATDSDETVKEIMGFLTLKQGDTDREYFDGYTPDRLSFCSQHAEYLEYEVTNRFEPVNGR